MIREVLIVVSAPSQGARHSTCHSRDGILKKPHMPNGRHHEERSDVAISLSIKANVKYGDCHGSLAMTWFGVCVVGVPFGTQA